MPPYCTLDFTWGERRCRQTTPYQIVTLLCMQAKSIIIIIIIMVIPLFVHPATIFEPLGGGIVVGSEDKAQMKPALFVISCGEGHLDLRTADKVMQTLLAKDAGESGLPSPATIISEKNYIIVWEISS